MRVVRHTERDLVNTQLLQTVHECEQRLFGLGILSGRDCLNGQLLVSVQNVQEWQTREN